MHIGLIGTNKKPNIDRANSEQKKSLDLRQGFKTGSPSRTRT